MILPLWRLSDWALMENCVEDWEMMGKDGTLNIDKGWVTNLGISGSSEGVTWRHRRRELVIGITKEGKIEWDNGKIGGGLRMDGMSEIWDDMISDDIAGGETYEIDGVEGRPS